MRRFAQAAIPLLLATACHSEPFELAPYRLGPLSEAPDTPLTVNPQQNYWPSWTQDGRGILYAFIPSPGAEHQCLGMLPADGGTRLWEMCDNRIGQADSASSFSGFAVSNTGALLYAEASGEPSVGGFPLHPVLWLADTTQPFNRTALVTLPVTVGGTPVTWLSEIAWTGPSTFMALGQQFSTTLQCLRCGITDTTYFTSGVVLTGTISGGQATLQAISGTSGASDYSLAASGTSVVFTRADDVALYQVPLAGGTPNKVAVVGGGGTELLGVSCGATTCVVGVDSVQLGESSSQSIIYPAVLGSGAWIAGVTLSTGQVQILYTSQSIVSTPRLSPTSGDVAVQLGGVWAHLQTFTTPVSELHLLRGLVQ